MTGHQMALMGLGLDNSICAIARECISLLQTQYLNELRRRTIDNWTLSSTVINIILIGGALTPLHASKTSRLIRVCLISMARFTILAT